MGQKHSEKRPVSFHTCPSCNHGEGFYYESYSYFHFFFIPLFKFSKKAYLECSDCGSIYSVDANKKDLFTRYEIKETLKFIRQCPSCEHALHSSDNFCPKCGHKIL